MGVGLMALFYGLFGGIDSGSAAASLLGLGAVLMMFGFAFLAPLLVRPLARGIGAPLARTQGLTGVLARENAIRQPQRTAVTAAALMVGLALVVLVTVFAAGLRGSVDKTIDDQVSAALIVQNQDGFTPIPDKVVAEVGKVPGVATASPIRFAAGLVKGVDGNTAATGIDPATVGSVLKLKWDQGDAETLSSLSDTQAVVDADWAEVARLRGRQDDGVHDADRQAGALRDHRHVQEPGGADRRASSSRPGRWRRSGTSRPSRS